MTYCSFSAIYNYLCICNKALMIKKIIFFLLVLVSFSATVFGADKPFTLVIDAGHGGHDSGAKGSFSYEKDINLNVALAFGRYVERNCPDVKVIYTRKTDVFCSVAQACRHSKQEQGRCVYLYTHKCAAGRTYSTRT